MPQVLVNHAINNVWCAPDQDQQVIVQPARVGPPGGLLSRATVNWESVSLPEPENRGKFWRVFVLGNLPPHLYNLPTAENVWIPLVDVCKDQGILVHAYTLGGVTYPLSSGYMRMIHDGTYVLAFRSLRNIPIDFENDTLNVRLYSNAYFRSQRWSTNPNGSLQPITAMGGIIGVDFTKSQWLGMVNTLPQQTVGHTFKYKNGYLVSTLTSSSITDGDYVEIVHDRSIKRVETYSLDDLDSFASIRDAKNKYIVYPSYVGDTIDFYDDVDFFLSRMDNGGTQWRGVLYNQNEDDGVRMLTHNSYSIPHQYVDDYKGRHTWLDKFSTDTNWDNGQGISLTVYVRHSGYERKLVDEHHRINELYRMPLSNIKEAMSGMNSLVPEWRAENLEDSGYVKLMDADRNSITDDVVADAYGYNAASKVMYPAIVDVEGAGDNRIAYREGEFLWPSIFSYDADGLLVGVREHNNGEVITPPVPVNRSRKLELLEDRLLEDVGNTFYGHLIVTAAEELVKVGFRCYVCDIVSGFPSEEWRDVTGDSNYYEISADGKSVEWKDNIISATNEYPAVRLGKHTWYRGEIPFVSAYSGAIEFDMSTTNSWSYPSTGDAPIQTYRPDTIPYGQVEVYAGTDKTRMQTLVQGIDYYVEWPKIVVVKAFNATPGNDLFLAARASSFCRDDLSMYPPREVGWVRDGLVSADDRRDTRNDRNCKIIVGGKMKTIDQVKLSEEDSGAPQINGQPFAVVDIIQPYEPVLSRNTETYRDISVEVDERVSDYVTTVDPGTPPAEVFPLPELYHLYDPFVSRLAHALKTGWLGNGELDQPYDINQIDTWVTPYKHLLDFDPILNGVSEVFATVTAHQYDQPMTLTLAQYRFIDRVVQNYLNGKILLSGQFIVEN